jgi:MFS family permease
MSELSVRPTWRTGVSVRSVWVGVLALCSVQFVDVLGVTVVVTALPAMLADLHASAEAGGLITTGYAMCFGGLLMLGARLGDRYGHRRVILAGLAVFAVAAVVGASAGSVPVLTAARCLQGAAAAVSVPSALRLLTTMTDEGPQRQRALAVWSAAGAAAGASGFVIGGVVTQLAGWRVVFWAYLPLALLLVLTVVMSVPADGEPDGPTRLNLAGAATFTAAIMLFVVATAVLPERHGAGTGGVLLAASVAVAGAFAAIDRRAAAPLLPRPLLRRRPLRQGAIGSFLNTATTSSAVTVATLYLQDTRGRSAVSAGLMLLPFSLAVIAGSALAARILGRWTPQTVIAGGLALIAISDATMIVAAPVSWALPVCVALGGAGIGLSSVAATGLGTSVAPAARGTASGILNTAAQVGTAVGIAVLLLIATVTTGAPERGSGVPAPAWATAAAVALAGAAFYAVRGRRASS